MVACVTQEQLLVSTYAFPQLCRKPFIYSLNKYLSRAYSVPELLSVPGIQNLTKYKELLPHTALTFEEGTAIIKIYT